MDNPRVLRGFSWLKFWLHKRKDGPSALLLTMCSTASPSLDPHSETREIGQALSFVRDGTEQPPSEV